MSVIHIWKEVLTSTKQYMQTHLKVEKDLKSTPFWECFHINFTSVHIQKERREVSLLLQDSKFKTNVSISHHAITAATLYQGRRSVLTAIVRNLTRCENLPLSCKKLASQLFMDRHYYSTQNYGKKNKARHGWGKGSLDSQHPPIQNANSLNANQSTFKSLLICKLTSKC